MGSWLIGMCYIYGVIRSRKYADIDQNWPQACLYVGSYRLGSNCFMANVRNVVLENPPTSSHLAGSGLPVDWWWRDCYCHDILCHCM
jgi:hypothetical protein